MAVSKTVLEDLARTGATIKLTLRGVSDYNSFNLVGLAGLCARNGSTFIIENAEILAKHALINIAKAGGRNVRFDFKQ